MCASLQKKTGENGRGGADGDRTVARERERLAWLAGLFGGYHPGRRCANKVEVEMEMFFFFQSSTALALLSRRLEPPNSAWPNICIPHDHFPPLDSNYFSSCAKFPHSFLFSLDLFLPLFFFTLLSFYLSPATHLHWWLPVGALAGIITSSPPSTWCARVPMT